MYGSVKYCRITKVTAQATLDFGHAYSESRETAANGDISRAIIVYTFAACVLKHQGSPISVCYQKGPRYFHIVEDAIHKQNIADV